MSCKGLLIGTPRALYAIPTITTTSQGEKTTVEHIEKFEGKALVDIIPHQALIAKTWREIDNVSLELVTDLGPNM